MLGGLLGDGHHGASAVDASEAGWRWA